MVLLLSYVSGYRKIWYITDKLLTGEHILDILEQKEGNALDVVLQCQGKIIYPSTIIDDEGMVTATLRLPGGKGGFGSMLRAIGAQIEKTTNREACRDLSGRRLRDINEEKRLKDFIAKRAERQRELQEKRLQKLKSLQESPRHVFQDKAYFKQREVREKNLHDSLDKAFASKNKDSSCTTKNLMEPLQKSKKRKFIDNLDDSSSEEENSDKEIEDIPQETIDVSVNNDNTIEQDKCHSTAWKKIRKNEKSSSIKKRTEEETVNRTKKGRLLEDLDDSSCEDEDKNSEETEAKPQETSDMDNKSKP